MANTPLLGLPLISQNQSQKHVTANGAFRDIDILLQLSVIQRGLNTPPGSPVEGDRYIVGTAPTGAWAGRPNRVAGFVDGVWRFYMPRKGWSSYVESDGASAVWNGTEWMASSGGGGGGGVTTPVSFKDSLVTFQDDADDTKKFLFQASAIATGGTVTLTVPNLSGTLALTNATQTFTGTTTFSGTSLIFGSSTAASTISVGSGATANAVSKTINLGTSGVAGSTTTLNIGSATAGSLGTTNLNSPTITFGVTNSVVNFAGATSFSGPQTTATLLYLGLGGATPDATNRFAINSPAVLFNHAGNNISATVNKGATGNEAAFTFQTAFSTRAIFGLLNDDDFTFKMSQNGSTFNTGIHLRAADGHVGVGGATADGNNALSIFGDVLLNRDSTNSVKMLLNKTGAANDAGFTFQTLFSTRALFGTLGSDDFTIKVSPNGSTFFDGVIFDRTTGKAKFPSTLQLVGQNGDPASPENGDVWYSFANNRLKARIDGVTSILGLSEVPYLVSPSGAYIRSATTPSAATTTVAGVANRTLLHPFIPKYDFTTSSLGINVTTAVTGSLAKIVVYSSDTLGRPDQRLTESGNIDCASVGAKESAISLDFKEGKQYWIGVRTSSTQTVSAHQAFCSPDLDLATITVTPTKTFARTLAFATDSPQSWVYNAAERSTILAPCVWLKIA